MSFEEEMKKVLKDGKIIIGEKKVKKGLLNGTVKMVVAAKNISDRTKEDFKRYAEMSDIKFYEYPDSSRELGYTCAKPFPVATIAVVDDGGSDILKV